MELTIKVWNSRTYALRQYENVKPSIDFEATLTEKEQKDLDAIIAKLKHKCDDYLEQCNPNPKVNDELPLTKTWVFVIKLLKSFTLLLVKSINWLIYS